VLCCDMLDCCRAHAGRGWHFAARFDTRGVSFKLTAPGWALPVQLASLWACAPSPPHLHNQRSHVVCTQLSQGCGSHSCMHACPSRACRLPATVCPRTTRTWSPCSQQPLGAPASWPAATPSPGREWLPHLLAACLPACPPPQHASMSLCLRLRLPAFDLCVDSDLAGFLSSRARSNAPITMLS
jgi:hypothetical protein